MPVSKRLRFEILRRDNHQCRYCGAAAPDVPLRVDHVVPVALGGTDDPSNLVAACHDCNAGKSSVPAGAALVEDVADDAVRWARAMQQAADEIAAEQDALDAICDAVYDAWRPRWIPNDYANSLYSIAKAGLAKDDLIDLVHVAHAARGVDDRWAYFCGCCWKRIKKRQERAQEILARHGDAVEPSPSKQHVLTTIWTTEQIECEMAGSIQFANAYCDDASIACIGCRHQDGGGHCSDPVCAIQYATTLSWLAMGRWDESSQRTERDEAVMAAAEDALDG